MTTTTPFEAMSPAERILHVQALWDRILAEGGEVPVTDAQRLDLERRVAAHGARPDAGASWEEVRARVRRGT